MRGFCTHPTDYPKRSISCILNGNLAPLLVPGVDQPGTQHQRDRVDPNLHIRVYSDTHTVQILDRGGEIKNDRCQENTCGDHPTGLVGCSPGDVDHREMMSKGKFD